MQEENRSMKKILTEKVIFFQEITDKKESL